VEKLKNPTARLTATFFDIKKDSMPLPTPRGDESEQDFVSRFMGNDQAISDFPDETQRAAVAYRTYRDEDEEMAELELGGVSILEVGEAKGHDLFVDKKSLESALEIMKSAKNGVKVKMNHGSGLDAVVGFARNPRIEGDKLVADLRLLRNSPHYGLIKEMAAEAPDQFGVSLAFVNESETINGKDYIRPQSIASADLVSSPAATNGLFEEMVKFMQKFAETQTKCSGETIKMGYMVGGKPIPTDLPEAEVEGEGLTKGENTMENKDYGKEVEDIKVRLAKLEEAMSPKEEEKEDSVPKIEVEVKPKEEMAKKEEPKTEEMSEVVKKVLTEFGIKPVPASPVIEEAPAKKEEPKNFEALVSAHPEYKTSKLNAMKAVMLSNPNEYREALSRGIKNI
jgi:hypothetical protein